MARAYEKNDMRADVLLTQQKVGHAEDQGKCEFIRVS